MAEFFLPPSDEPADFRRQASAYGVYRRDYSEGLYRAIERHTGPGDGRLAFDLGCGTGLITRALRERGWQAVGIDFSEPMLAVARSDGAMPDQTDQDHARLDLVRARGEELPIRGESAALVTCGTAFHWFASAPTLAGIHRALVPGGSVALFWRYPQPDQPYHRLVMDVLGRFRDNLPEHPIFVHPSDPYLQASDSGFRLESEPAPVLETDLDYTVDSFHGYISTLEWIRRLAGPAHVEFLAALRVELEKRHPKGFRERNHEYLFLARKPTAR